MLNAMQSIGVFILPRRLRRRVSTPSHPFITRSRPFENSGQYKPIIETRAQATGESPPQIRERGFKAGILNFYRRISRIPHVPVEAGVPNFHAPVEDLEHTTNPSANSSPATLKPDYYLGLSGHSPRCHSPHVGSEINSSWQDSRLNLPPTESDNSLGFWLSYPLSGGGIETSYISGHVPLGLYDVNFVELGQLNSNFNFNFNREDLQTTEPSAYSSRSTIPGNSHEFCSRTQPDSGFHVAQGVQWSDVHMRNIPRREFIPNSTPWQDSSTAARPF
ncbi:hypothetical protein M413DRAFT_29412 [Hebeloma cylindrosporum]|uniref:Uncharacterized protein n=1 Tax=Hebeloma cylindrosporum TaxID=76867 RepID=A0A0C3BRD4_HEBCY|nr:hypothetical protein M413DRAFT_29412 [Hebeloma cylindrosporum h7]